MKMKSMLFFCLCLTPFLKGMPSCFIEKIEEAQNNLQALSEDLSEGRILEVKNELLKVCNNLNAEYEKIDIKTNSSYDDVPEYCGALRCDIKFLEVLSLYRSEKSSDLVEKLQRWANSCFRYAPIVEKALKDSF